MAGRALVFSDAEIVRMAAEDFVPVAADDWYQRRRQDAEGEFFRGVADQGPRKGEGGSTRQGIYCLTASGKLLAYRNAQDPEVMREVLASALDAWRSLPAAERRAGALVVPELSAAELDADYVRTPPQGGLIADVHTRALECDNAGQWKTCGGDATGYAGFAGATDHLWLTESEWRSLIPKDPIVGRSQRLPAPIADRIARYHLVDNTRGEPPHWRRDDIRFNKIKLTVESADADEIELRIEGKTLVATDADPTKAARGFDASLVGFIAYDRRQDRITRFDVAALGDHWGEGPFTRGARPGRAPLAVVVELISGNHPADFVPPQGMRDRWEYLNGEL